MRKPVDSPARPSRLAQTLAVDLYTNVHSDDFITTIGIAIYRIPKPRRSQPVGDNQHGNYSSPSDTKHINRRMPD